MAYYAVDPRTGELKHWKYLFKKKINGKWRYYYADDFDDDPTDTEGQAYEKVSGDPNSKYGTYVHDSKKQKYTVTVKKGKGLLSSKTTVADNARQGGRRRVATQVREIGKIEQGVDSARKFTKKTLKSARKQIDKGRRWVEGLFD